MQPTTLSPAYAPAAYLEAFVKSNQHLTAKTWQSLAAAIRPFGIPTESEHDQQSYSVTTEQLRCVLDKELARTMQQAELDASLPNSAGPSAGRTDDTPCLSQLEVTLYSMLLALKLLASTCPRKSSTVCLRRILLFALWQLSFKFKDLLPEKDDEETAQPGYYATRLVATLARVVTSLYTLRHAPTQLCLKGQGSGYMFPSDLLCSFPSLHPSLQQAAAAEIGSKGKHSTADCSHVARP